MRYRYRVCGGEFVGQESDIDSKITGSIQSFNNQEIVWLFLQIIIKYIMKYFFSHVVDR